MIAREPNLRRVAHFVSRDPHHFLQQRLTHALLPMQLARRPRSYDTLTADLAALVLLACAAFHAEDSGPDELIAEKGPDDDVRLGKP